MAQQISFSNLRQARRRPRRTGPRQPPAADDAVAVSWTHPGRSTVRPCRPIPAQAVRTVRRPKCAPRKRWSRHPDTAGAVSLRLPGRSETLNEVCCFERRSAQLEHTLHWMGSAAMLDEFIVANREEIIRRCRTKVAARAVSTSSKAEVAHGVPVFLDQLVEALRDH